jgi:hypothetical protein
MLTSIDHARRAHANIGSPWRDHQGGLHLESQKRGQIVYTIYATNLLHR